MAEVPVRSRVFGVAVNKPGEFDPVFIEGAPSPDIRWVRDQDSGEPLTFAARSAAEQWIRDEQMRSLRERLAAGA